MSNHSYSLAIIVAMTFFINSAVSPTYSFVYRFTDSILLSFDKDKDKNSGGDSAITDFLNKLPVYAEGTYHIVSNGKYMIATAGIHSSFSGIRPLEINFTVQKLF